MANTLNMDTGLDRSEPWIEDGNVILAAQGKCFRVHRSTLAFYSDVFCDMFTIPHPGDAEENTMDGCPIVHLHDSPDDVRIILKALYDRSYMFFRDEPMSIAVLTAFLRLGKKYAIQQLLKEAVDRLSFDVPLLAQRSKLDSGVKLFPRVSGKDSCNFTIMNVASEMGLLSAVAITAYLCSITCSVPVILDGYDEEGEKYTLSPINQRYCLIGKNYIAEAKQELSAWLAETIADSDCGCSSTWSMVLLSLSGNSNPLSPWSGYWDTDLCKYCREKKKDVYEGIKGDLWVKFPTSLGLGSWEELEKQ